MAEKKDYTLGVPTVPPDGMLEWLKEAGALGKNVLVYEHAYVTDETSGSKKKAVLCKCIVHSFHYSFRCIFTIIQNPFFI